MRLLPELGSGKVEVDNFAAVEIADEIQSSHAAPIPSRHRRCCRDAANELN